MQTLDALLDEYGQSHVNPVNKAIHWICVPVIVWTVVALLWSIPFPSAPQSDVVPLNWATIGLFLVQVYYFSLSARLGLGLLLYNVLMLWIAELADAAAPWPLWQIALSLFVLAWIGQFIGHIVEGRKPSFFRDVQFLLIGPAWLMSFVYRILGLKF